MVFLSIANFVRSRGPDEFWRKRKIFKMAAHYIGRRRNCYSITIRSVHRAMAYATEGRQLKKEDMADLWKTRIMAGCEQHGVNFHTFRDGLYESNIQLNKKMLADLAIWEPKTFESLAKISRTSAIESDVPGVQGQLPDEPLKKPSS